MLTGVCGKVVEAATQMPTQHCELPRTERMNLQVVAFVELFQFPLEETRDKFRIGGMIKLH